jgi:urea transport system ATP-binding protein
MFIWGDKMLELNSLSLHYGSAPALIDISLTCEVGKVTTLLGRNGMGKTSTIRAICGHHPITSGAIIYQGNDISKLKSHERAKLGIACVPQGREIFPLLTVKENLETGFATLDRRDHSFPDYIFDLFPVLKDMLKRRGGDLSGGQQQQLSIARALIMQPKLLVLDEPTEGIQPSVIKDIGRAISMLRSEGKMAILLVEQYFEFARDLCDSYAVLEKGRVVLSGSRAELNEADVLKRMAV